MSKPKKIGTIGIALKPSGFEDLPNIMNNLIRWLLKRKKKIVFLEHEEKRFSVSVSSKLFKEVHFWKQKEFYNQTDLIISLGGPLGRIQSPTNGS